MDTIHVVPTNDTFPHREEGTLCWCKPTVLEEENGEIVVHNSFDERERFEAMLEAAKEK